MDEQLTWLVSSSGVDTDDAGWVARLSGTAAELHATGYRPASTTTVDAYFVRKVFDADPTSGAVPRVTDGIDFQFRFAGSTSTPVAWDASGVHGALVDDGNRAVGVGVGVALEWIDPYTGDVIAEIQPAFPWQVEGVLLLRKIGSERFELWQEGKLLATLPYEAGVDTDPAPGGADVFDAARVGFGRLNTAGSGLGAWDRLEVGLNRAVPQEWQVRRMEKTAPAPVRNRWNERWEAFARAFAGQAQQARDAIAGAWGALTAGTISFDRVSFVGDELPPTEDASWSFLGVGGDAAVTGDRIALSWEA